MAILRKKSQKNYFKVPPKNLNDFEQIWPKVTTGGGSQNLKWKFWLGVCDILTPVKKKIRILKKNWQILTFSEIGQNSGSGQIPGSGQNRLRHVFCLQTRFWKRACCKQILVGGVRHFDTRLEENPGSDKKMAKKWSGTKSV